MRTYTAELAPWRLEPLHPKFVEAAHEDVDRIMSPGPRRHAFEAMCPYCGTEGDDALVGTIRIGAKEQVSDIAMTSTGYDVPDVRDRETEILIIHCTNDECGAAVDPTAYLSPAVFYADKEGEQLLPEL